MELVDVRHVRAQRLPQLRGHQVPDRVRREVADHPGAPVDVLQDALEHRRGLQAEQPVRGLVPGVREVGDAQPPLDQGQLELEPQRDVQVVRRLVGLDPDQREPHLVDGAIELVDVPGVERVPEVALHDRQDPLGEGLAAADEVLPQPALGLVGAEAGGVGERRPVVRGRHLRLVQAVPELVQAGVERHREVVGLPARREPHVRVRHRARERVHRRVQAPVLGVVADGLQELPRERLLALRREVAREDAAVLPRRRGRRDERDELLLDVREQPAQLLGREAGLVVVEQDVVRVRELARVVEARDVPLLELQEMLERRRERLEARLLARLEPGLLRVCRRPRHLRGEVRGHADGLLVVALEHGDQPHVVRVRVLRSRPRLQLVEDAAELRVGQARVLDPLERLELIRARVRPTRRHHRVLVPQQQAADPVEIGDLAGAPVQFGKLVHRPALA